MDVTLSEHKEKAFCQVHCFCVQHLLPAPLPTCHILGLHCFCEQLALCLAWLPSPVQGTHVVTGRLAAAYLSPRWLALFTAPPFACLSCFTIVLISCLPVLLDACRLPASQECGACPFWGLRCGCRFFASCILG